MVSITVGVPVYNGADLLDESLACIARQTFRDFKVVISDNGSTDATPEIARRWAARDERFHYLRRATQVSAFVNFRDLLAAADSPWFLWRADDDLSDDNFLEVLFRLANSAPGCDLAVATVVSQDLDGGRRRVFPPPHVADPTSLGGRLRMLFGSHPAWFYALWRTSTIRQVFCDLCENYPYPYAGDHAALYGPIIGGAVRATLETRFIQRARRTAATPRRQTRMPFARMVEARRALRKELRRVRDQRRLSPQLRTALVALELLYLQRMLPSVQKMARTRLREWLGIAGKQDSGGPYFERIETSAAAPAPPTGDPEPRRDG